MSYLMELKDIRKTYDLGIQKIEVLKGINLNISTGDFVSIMGQSGSGKSTLMNIIGMLDVPTTGEYFFNDKLVSQLSSDEQSLLRRKNIGFIFQNYNLIKKTSALEQVILPLIYQGYGKNEREKKAKIALEKVGLQDYMKNLPSEMSGGQQQRVAIARAIVGDPYLILADEPTGALDSKTGHEIMNIITNLNSEGKTVLIITHAKEVDEYATTHISIKDGNIN